ncbi:flagellar filament capping protein FliD [Alienimonas californiensis]|uniref:Filament cap protein n=1 Tax=Alienimonas californiensis TaxID=2527989 RepID=A0A517P772_9PLAN|nr:flagellar filament capping protein FliD [Alienimonas californiensis]QDT15205.1 Flagellar hook-associated protein 2 [Alienimonas californiensis]
MSVVTSSIGLATGIDTGAIIEALINAQKGTISKLTNRQATLKAEASGLDALSAFALTVGVAAERLGKPETFDAHTVKASDPNAIAVSATAKSPTGSTVFTPLRTASAHASSTRGFASPDAAVGVGDLVFSQHPGVKGETPLDLLNGGEGVRRGEVRVTDAAGNVATVDLSAARTTADVLNAFNNAEGVALNARVEGGSFVLEDLSNPTGSAGTLTVADIGGGRTASDLGLVGSGAGTIAGREVYAVSGEFTFDLMDDGIGLKTVGQPADPDDPDAEGPLDDLGIELADGTAFSLDLDAAPTLAGLVAAINNHEDNAGKLTAALTDGRLVLTDHTDPAGTGGADVLTLTNLNGADVLRGLGLTNAVDLDVNGDGDDQLVGGKLLAGLDSVLLRNMGGPGGIAGGEIQLTNRAGASATLDLSAAESLDEIVAAINGSGLNLRAEAGEKGLTIVDSSGGSGSLAIADLAGTLAADLGIAGTFADDEAVGGAVARRSVGRTTALADFAGKITGGGANGVRGDLTVTDSAGVAVTVKLNDLADDATLGDFLDAFNTAAAAANGGAGAGVTAELNATGDGFRLIDTAGGAGELTVTDNVAADALRLTGTVKNGTLSARDATVLTLEAGDTLQDLADRLNAGDFGVKAEIADDGTTLAPSRLLLSAKATGASGRFRIDDSGLAAPFAGARAGLGAAVSVQGEDALLAVGGNASGGFLRADADGVFEDLPGGVGVTIKQATGEPVTVTVGRDSAGVGNALQAFVSAYNGLIDLAADLTKFDPETNQRGVLQGNSTVGRVLRRVESLLTKRFGPDITAAAVAEGADPPRTMFDVGIRLEKDGKISLNRDRLNERLADDPVGTRAFFQDKTNGFAVATDALMDGLTDQFDGLLQLESDSLESRRTEIGDRVADLEAQLALKRDRLVRQFAAMEETVSRINSFQSALSNIRLLEMPSQNR